MNMAQFRVTAFTLASVVLCFQGVHFTYFKFFPSHDSVLNDYVDKQIQEAASLDELIQDYEAALKEVEAYEAASPDIGVLTRYQQLSIEPYKTKLRLEDAINTWEEKEREYVRVLYQWTAGFTLYFIGMLLFNWKATWAAMSLRFAGLLEMIWWSSPTRMMVGALAEYERLLNLKLLLTIMTFAMVMGVWLFVESRVGGEFQSKIGKSAK